MQLRVPGVVPVVLVSAMIAATPGCAGPTGPGGRPAQKRGYSPPPPKAPPAAPAAQNVPLDPALKAAARREISEALRSSDALVRSQAIEALRYSADADAPRQILAALKDPQAGVRFGAAMMAGELKLRDAYPQLLRMVDDRNLNVQVAVRYALHRLNDKRFSQDLGKFSTNHDPRVRRNVALVLGLLGEKSALTTILPPLKVDADPLVRQQAYEAMWRLGDERALKPLVALTASAYADDKIVGLLAVAAPRRTIVREHVRGLLAGDDVHTEVTLVAARAMGMLGSDEGYQIALDGASSGDPNQRFLAALALGAIGRADAQDELRRLLSDPVPNVQLAAATAVLQLNNKARAQG